MMKKLLLFLALTICFSARSQDTLMKPMERAKPEPAKEHFKLYRIFPNGIGDNVLAKANKGKFGIGAGVTFFTYYQFHLIGGYEFMQYEVTDASLAGNIKNTNLANYSLAVLYKIPVIRNLDFNPQLGVSYMTLRQKTHSVNYGQQSGTGVSAGFDADYKISGNFRIFAGANYAWSFPETNTNAEYKDFFGKLQQVNIQLGIKF